MKSWIQISVNSADLPTEVTEAMKESVADLCGGLEELTEESGMPLFRGYVAYSDQGKAQLNLLKESLTRIEQSAGLESGAITENLTTDTIQNVDWDTNWKQYYKQQRIGKHFIVYPSWDKPTDAQETDHLILLDPGQAFGTGQHETTRLCIELMEDLDISGWKIADVGCGSGILSIAAVMSGAEKIFACDIDSVAVETAQENAEINGVDASIDFKTGSVTTVKSVAPYDLIFANILAEVLINLGEELRSIMRPGGQMIWSGIIQEQMSNIESCVADLGLKVLQVKRDGEWAGYLIGDGRSF